MRLPNSISKLTILFCRVFVIFASNQRSLSRLGQKLQVAPLLQLFVEKKYSLIASYVETAHQKLTCNIFRMILQSSLSNRQPSQSHRQFLQVGLVLDSSIVIYTSTRPSQIRNFPYCRQKGRENLHSSKLLLNSTTYFVFLPCYRCFAVNRVVSTGCIWVARSSFWSPADSNI